MPNSGNGFLQGRRYLVHTSEDDHIRWAVDQRGKPVSSSVDVHKMRSEERRVAEIALLLIKK